MRKFLSQYLSIPSYTTLAIEIQQLMPILQKPNDFMMNGKVIGKCWPVLNVLQNTVLDILNTNHGETPDRVPKELWIKGGFGGDGFSGCCDRVGKDIDLNTTSRYFVGLKIARLLGERKSPESLAPEYFVETSQSFVSVKPILIAEFKENKETLHHTWKWFEEQWEMVKKFTIQFDSREITIHFVDPKFIGDGKGYLQLLSLPGLCALVHQRWSVGW
jgi:hypothetical protein